MSANLLFSFHYVCLLGLLLILIFITSALRSLFAFEKSESMFIVVIFFSFFALLFNLVVSFGSLYHVWASFIIKNRAHTAHTDRQTDRRLQKCNIINSLVYNLSGYLNFERRKRLTTGLVLDLITITFTLCIQ